MDFGRILGALVQGAATPPRRRRSAGAFGMTATQTRQLGRVLGSLAEAAMDAMKAPPAPRAPGGRGPVRDTAPRGPGRDTAPRGPDREPAPRGPGRDTAPRGPVRDTAPPGPDREPAPRIPQTGNSPWTPRPGTEPPAPRDEPGAEHAEAVLLTQTMIAAARADGVTDAKERAAIARQLDTAGLTAAERDHVLASFDKPATPEALAVQAGDPMLRAQLYAAAVAAMGEITLPERGWLDRLGVALKLDQAARTSIEARLRG